MPSNRPVFKEKGVIGSMAKKVVYKDGLTTMERRVKIVKKVSNGCWWVESYLMDSCGISSKWEGSRKK